MGNPDQGHTEDEIERLRKALEAETQRCLEVQRRLDRANADFEEFVSIAAHDLRESLRDVASFSQLMSETYASHLDSGAGEFLERIREGAARAQSLLADVVDYWATGTGDPQSSRTDMEAALCQALLSMDKQVTERSAIVTHDPLPRVCGDFETLTKVLHHLIRNAIEYCGGPSPHVHVSSRRVDLDWVLPCKTTVPVLTPHSRGAYSECSSACTGRNTPGTGLASPSARRPSSGMAAGCGWNRHPGPDRHSISPCRRRIEGGRLSPRPAGAFTGGSLPWTG